MNSIRPELPNLNPDLPLKIRNRLESDFRSFAAHGLPQPLEPYLLDTYHLDVATTYGGLAIKNPWGKASGQLSMTPQQVQEDAEGGLGFCVLKTVIAQNAMGSQSMHAWAIPEAKMNLEKVRGASGETGWTVSWKGRGWHRSFHDYLELVRQARSVGKAANMLIVPSCKYHLPTNNREAWNAAEYEYTTQALLSAYCMQSNVADPMPLEKDFSPTLAGSALATDRNQILEWLRHVPSLIRGSSGNAPIRIGLKLFNSLFDDSFQLEMLQAVVTLGSGRPDFVVYANRLFDPDRVFEDHRGIAFGGPDLSARNLRVLDQFQKWLRSQDRAVATIEISGTGDICNGRKAVEYLLRGSSNLQMHTLFQLPATEYAMRHGSKTTRAIHRLYFDPTEGFIAWARHVASRKGFTWNQTVSIADLVGAGDQCLG